MVHICEWRHYNPNPDPHDVQLDSWRMAVEENNVRGNLRVENVRGEYPDTGSIIEFIHKKSSHVTK